MIQGLRWVRIVTRDSIHASIFCKLKGDSVTRKIRSNDEFRPKQRTANWFKLFWYYAKRLDILTYQPLAKRLDILTYRPIAKRLDILTYRPLAKRIDNLTYRPLAKRLDILTYPPLAKRLDI